LPEPPTRTLKPPTHRAPPRRRMIRRSPRRGSARRVAVISWSSGYPHGSDGADGEVVAA
jgi:hypothetical protein